MICFECLEVLYTASRSPQTVRDQGGAVWKDMTDVEMLEKLPLILTSAQQNAAFANDWVALLRERNISWAAIGQALGVSRQAAWERFASSAPPARRRAAR